MRIESHHDSEMKKRWKVVRLDNYTDVPGEIVTADETTGECNMHIVGKDGSAETKTLNFGHGGIKLVGRAR